MRNQWIDYPSIGRNEGGYNGKKKPDWLKGQPIRSEVFYHVLWGRVTVGIPPASTLGWISHKYSQKGAGGNPKSLYRDRRTGAGRNYSRESWD